MMESDCAPDQFHRLQLLVGSEGLTALANTRVIIFGLGGVGGWAAEAMVRSAISNMTIVDSDTVCITNINRQIQASHNSVGKLKCDELKQRLLSINPTANITAIPTHYSRDTADQFNLDDYDYVIDAIDTLSCKIELIVNALKSSATLFSSLGAGRRMDPSRVRTADIWQTRGCRLGHFVRKRLRKRGIRQGFTCVYSNELMATPPEFDGIEDLPNGSAAHITGIFGFHLCGLVTRDILRPIKSVRALS